MVAEFNQRQAALTSGSLYMAGQAESASRIGHPQKVSVSRIMDIMACRTFDLRCVAYPATFDEQR